MLNCKVRTETREDSIAVQRKAIAMGYLWGGTRTGGVYEDYTQHALTLRENGIMLRCIYSETFQASELPELSVAEFLRYGDDVPQAPQNPELIEPEILNTKINSMSELKLKCVKEPKKAKNITVGAEYEGILINEEGTQVDTMKEAKFFFCENNSGNEGRYSISLFQEIRAARPVPPPPPVIPPVNIDAYVDFDENFIDNDGAYFIGNERVVRIDSSDNEDNGVNYKIVLMEPNPERNNINTFIEQLVFGYSTVSCGVCQIYNLEAFWRRLKDVLSRFNNQYYNNSLTEEKINSVASLMLSKLIQLILVDQTKRFGILSSHTETASLVAAMNSIDVNGGSVTGHNDNSGNNIAVWIVKKDD